MITSKTAAFCTRVPSCFYLLLFLLLLLLLLLLFRERKGGRLRREWKRKRQRNPITRRHLKNLFFKFCQTWTKRYLVILQTRVKRARRVHHLMMARWCIRLTRLTLVCEVIRYRFVQVRRNLNDYLSENICPLFTAMLLPSTSTVCSCKCDIQGYQDGKLCKVEVFLNYTRLLMIISWKSWKAQWIIFFFFLILMPWCNCVVMILFRQTHLWHLLLSCCSFRRSEFSWAGVRPDQEPGPVSHAFLHGRETRSVRHRHTSHRGALLSPADWLLNDVDGHCKIIDVLIKFSNNRTHECFVLC